MGKSYLQRQTKLDSSENNLRKFGYYLHVQIVKVFKLLIMMVLTTWLTACFSGVETKFAFDAPIVKIVSDTENQLLSNAFYHSTPNENIIVSSETEFLKSKFSAFNKQTGKQIWQTNFEAFYVGQTEKNILVYDGQNVIWLNPNDGEITRKISNIPNPIKTSFDFNSYLLNGMAFNDEIYITTKPLYQQIYDAHQKQDDSYKIGITANNWEKNNQIWFVSPVKQIVNIAFKPVIFGDKMLVVNSPQSIDGKQSYQIISLKDGEEIRRAETIGKYFLIGKNYLFELNENKISRLDFSENKPAWSVENSQIPGTDISAMGSQITISNPNSDKTRNIKILAADSGKELKRFNLPDVQNTVFDCAFLLKDGNVVLHFMKNRTIDKNYDYFVGWNVETNKATWRTSFDDQNLSSLIDETNANVRIEK